ncbi:MAG: ParB/RepB/Spo0J family partition protein [Patescibacteria group bacterium]
MVKIKGKFFKPLTGELKMVVSTVVKLKENSVYDNQKVFVPIGQIRPNPDQPRQHFDEDRLHALRISIRTEGQLIPVFLRPVKDERVLRQGIKYDLIDGERRWRAASMEGSGIEELEAIIKECDDEKQYITSCAVNFNREDHTPYEEMVMIHKLVKVYGHSQTYVANLLGKSQMWVSSRILAYERLSPVAMMALRKDEIPITVATTLSKLKPSDQASELKKYKAGGTISDIKVAVQRASERGHTQSGTRQLDTRDYRRYVEKTIEILDERFDRIDAIGVRSIQRGLTSLDDKTLRSLKLRLQKNEKRIHELVSSVDRVLDM